MSREEVLKYLEVHFFSLALTAIGIFVVCVFLLFFFISRGEYIYAAVVIVLMVIALLGALELERFAKILKKQEKATTQKTQITPFASVLV